MSGSPQDRRDVQALLRRIWAAVVRYRRMVAAMVTLAVLQTVFTKLPFLVVKPLMAEMGRELGERPAAAPGLDGELEDAFNAWFQDFAAGLCRLLGMSFDSPGMNVVAGAGLLSITFPRDLFWS